MIKYIDKYFKAKNSQIYYFFNFLEHLDINFYDLFVAFLSMAFLKKLIAKINKKQPGRKNACKRQISSLILATVVHVLHICNGIFH